jgi:hypothetical protein
MLRWESAPIRSVTNNLQKLARLEPTGQAKTSWNGSFDAAPRMVVLVFLETKTLSGV